MPWHLQTLKHSLKLNEVQRVLKAVLQVWVVRTGSERQQWPVGVSVAMSELFYPKVQDSQSLEFNDGLGP